jgi:hypothetical protein
MTGGRASAVFGETLWRRLYLSKCSNELSRKRSCSSASPVTHSSGDPPYRGPEKTTLVGQPPVTDRLPERANSCCLGGAKLL